MVAQTSSLSATDKWIMTYERYGENLSNLQGFFIKELPFSILKELSEKIERAWNKYEPYIHRLDPQATDAKKFIAIISEDKSRRKLTELLKLDNDTHNFLIINCLTQCKSLANEHKKADLDLSKGFLRDFDLETIVGLSREIATGSVDWRLLADGLGFTNGECRSLENPKMMLEKYMKKKPEASVSRLFFETERLGMKSVCFYLNAIPLEATSKVTLCDEETIFSNKVTRFEIERLDAICLENGFKIEWNIAAKKLCNWMVENNSKTDKRNLFWQSPNFNSCNLYYALECDKNLKASILEFEEEKEMGIFENISPGGITLGQIDYLCSSISKVNILSVSLNFQERAKGFINMDVIKNRFYPNLHLESPLTFSHFLFLYWQDPQLGANLDINAFCLKIIDILQNTKESYGFGVQDQEACRFPEVIEAFRVAYLAIKPWRSFDPVLFVKNLATELRNKAISINEIAPKALNQEKVKELTIENLDDKCGICMEKEKNVVLVPCGHLGFCLECIANTKNCPACRKEIMQKLRVYKI